MKLAALLPGVELQPHQKRVRGIAESTPDTRLLLLHGLGSGKSLSGLSAADAKGLPYTTITPASLRPNIQKEQAKFLDPENTPPSANVSYNSLAKGEAVPHPDSLVFDEVQALRNPDSARTRAAIAAARNAKQVILATGTPVVNHPSDFASLYSILTGKPMSRESFAEQFVREPAEKPGLLSRLFGSDPPGVKNYKQLQSDLAGKIDVHEAETPPARVDRETIPVRMSKDQAALYRGMYDKIPLLLRNKIKQDYPLTPAELKRLTGFLTGPRQVGLSTLPFMRGKADPLKAFDRSPKLQAALDRLTATLSSNPDAKALVFANYVDAGLTPYQAALQRAGIPAAVFSGKLNDAGRKRLVDDYNAGRIRAALLGPSGTEGLSFKGTRLVQRLDPHWHNVRQDQAAGRALRLDSHLHLDPEDRQVTLQDYVSRLPGLLGSKPGVDDWLAARAAGREELNKQFVDVLRQIGRNTSRG